MDAVGRLHSVLLLVLKADAADIYVAKRLEMGDGEDVCMQDDRTRD